MKDTNTTPTGSPAEPESGLPSDQKLTLWQKLKKPFRLKVNLPNGAVAESAAAESEAEVEAEAPKKEEKKKAKPKKIQRSKPQRARAAKPVKKKTKKDTDSKKGPIAIISISTVLLAGAVVAGIMIFRSMGTIDSQFEKAEKYVADQKYDNAIEVYNNLLTEGSDEEVTRAYLGLADAYVQKEDVDSAVANLQVGYGITQDARLSDKIQELAPEIAEEEPDAPPPEDQVITFSDPSFGKMIHQALSIPESESILQKDLDKVRSLKIIGDTHSVANDALPIINTSEGYTIGGQLFTAHGDITSLDDLQYFQNLTKLTIGYNSISDVSGLSKANSLEMLGLYANNIGDLSVLSGMKELKWLYLYHNNISDLSPLSELTELRHLYLQHNSITDLTPLASLSKLEELFVDNNRITDISTVAKLQGLRFFSAKNNEIRDISPISGLTSLTDVSFVGNPVGDYSPAASVANVNKSFGRPM